MLEKIKSKNSGTDKPSSKDKSYLMTNDDGFSQLEDFNKKK